MFDKAVEVLDWFKSLNKPALVPTVQVRDDFFAVKQDGTLGDPIHPVLPLAPVATPVLQLATLTGLVAAFVADVDGLTLGGKAAVQVVGYDEVAIVSLAADQWGRRHVWARAKCAEVNPFPFEQLIDQELFLIKAQASFLPVDGHYTAMLALCSSLSANSTVTLADDGFSQTVVVTEGGVTRGSVNVPPRLDLRAYRSFREIDPVESGFLLRFKAGKGEVPKLALYPVDANRWKTDTAAAVGAWLAKSLPAGTTIIA